MGRNSLPSTTCESLVDTPDADHSHSWATYSTRKTASRVWRYQKCRCGARSKEQSPLDSVRRYGKSLLIGGCGDSIAADIHNVSGDNLSVNGTNRGELNVPYMSIEQLAQRWGVSETTVRRLRTLGEIPKGITVGRQIRVPGDEIQAWELAQRGVQPSPLAVSTEPIIEVTK